MPMAAQLVGVGLAAHMECRVLLATSAEAMDAKFLGAGSAELVAAVRGLEVTELVDGLYSANAEDVDIVRSTTFMIGTLLMSSLDAINTGHATGTQTGGVKLGRALETYLIRHAPQTIAARPAAVDVQQLTREVISVLAEDADQVREDQLTLPATMRAAPAAPTDTTSAGASL